MLNSALLMNTYAPHDRILWRQVWGLAALLAAVLLSFLAYGLYQSRILADLGFVGLAAHLGILQGCLAAILEPLVGGFSDCLLDRYGSRLPQITAGVTLAGLLFIGLALLLQPQMPLIVQACIPILMTIWVIAMVIFRGPAIGMLMQFAPLQQLPQANAVFILTLGLMGAIAPLLQKFMLQFGASLTFILGAIALTLAALLFANSVSLRPQPPRIAPIPPRRFMVALAWLTFVVGLATGLIMQLLWATFPPLFSQQLLNHRIELAPEIVTSLLLFICALTAVPLGNLITQQGAIWGIQRGLSAIALLMFSGLAVQRLMSSIAFTLVFMFAFGIALGLTFVSTIPYALSIVPPQKAGLGTGLYFGGSGLAASLGMLMMQGGRLSLMTSVILVAIATLIALACLQRTQVMRQRLTVPPPS